MDKADWWDLESTEPVADCSVFRVTKETFRRRTGGDASNFYVIDSPDWVNVIAFTKDQKILVIRQFRFGIREICLEIPAGIIDEGEEPEAAARRELLEETGYSSERWKLLGSSRPNPAIQNNKIFHYASFDCEKTSDASFDPNESIETMTMEQDEVLAAMREGHLNHSLIIAAFQYLTLHEGQVREQKA